LQPSGHLLAFATFVKLLWGLLALLPLENTQDVKPETALQQLFQFLVKGAQITFDGIRALFLHWSQQSFNPLADKGYAVIGTIFRFHETAFFAHIRTYILREAGGNYLPVIVKIDEQIDCRDMVFPPGATLPAAFSTYLSGAHPLPYQLEGLLA
jgi:hypothetical protein